ncbi:Clavaminate synthase-like protein [Nemania sp. NC0429]|nr:Clavaminate synthase-like protein [Nemania sp. NC0429]
MLPRAAPGRLLRSASRPVHRLSGCGLQFQGRHMSRSQPALYPRNPDSKGTGRLRGPKVWSDRPLTPQPWLGGELRVQAELSPEPLTVPPPAEEDHGLLEALEPHSGFSWTTHGASLSDVVSYHYPLSDARPIVAHRSWLRDACTCARCVDPSSGQKRFASTDVPDDLRISALATVDGKLEVMWEDDFLTGGTHRSTYPRVLWRNIPTWRRGILNTQQIPILWNRELLGQVEPYYSFRSFFEDQSVYLSAMKALCEYGLIFLRDVPSSEKTVKEIATQIGVIQNTFYGTTWDVVSKPNAENVAYTNSYLGLHQDLLYMNNVPRIQILHCLQNTCSGGESLFGDSFLAKSLLRKYHPQYNAALVSRGVVYAYNKGGHMYEQLRPTFSRKGVWWSPPFQSPFQADDLSAKAMAVYSQWREGTRLLRDIIEDEANVYEYKMQAGDCVIFDNHRILHGRRAFDTSSGDRWLKGAYVDSDSFLSKVASLNLSSTWLTRDDDDPGKIDLPQ